MNRNQLFFPVFGSSHEDQDALTIFLQPDVEMPTVGPHVHVLLSFQRTLRPVAVFLLPDSFEAGNRRGRKSRYLTSQDRFQRFSKIIRADSFEVKPGNQLLNTLRLAQVRREKLRRELLRFRRRSWTRGCSISI